MERQIPEGYEWPRYTSGEMVEIGDEVVGPDYGEQFKVSSVEFHANGFTLHDKNGFSKWYESDDRFERPAVLAADGEPLEAGQTVWGVEDGKEFEVVNVNGELPLLKYGETAYTATEPEQLTHKRPVLDADGVPIKVGDTVYDINDGTELVITSIALDYLDHVRARQEKPVRASVSISPLRLTHTKPEPDSWSSVWMDVSNGCETPQGMERRCRALAERGE